MLAVLYLNLFEQIKQVKIGVVPCMELRAHPFMTHMRTRSWPPVRRGREGLSNEAKIGVLMQVISHEDTPERCFLLMKYQKELENQIRVSEINPNRRSL